MINKIVKNILLTICWILLVAGIATSFIAGERIRKNIRCEKIEIRILDSLENSFISSPDVSKLVSDEYGEVIGLLLDSINLETIEEIVDNKSAVKKSQVYITKDGTLNIDITQREPVVRFQKTDGGFYADAEGYIFPLQKNYSSHVQIIDGNIPLSAKSGYKGHLGSENERNWFKQIMELVNFIEGDRDWKGKIVQIYVDRKGDITLIPREGKEKFLIGKPENIEDKFLRMGKYYTAIVPEKGSNIYEEVDLRYKGQIVCR